LSFPRRRESRNVLLKKLDARLRGHDGKNSSTAQLTEPIEQIRPIKLMKPAFKALSLNL
jgi:hypothetical protein